MVSLPEKPAGRQCDECLLAQNCRAAQMVKLIVLMREQINSPKKGSLTFNFAGPHITPVLTTNGPTITASQ